MQRQHRFDHDVAIVGGCGHVGLPLGIAFADRGASVVLYDVDADSVALVGSGRLPFREDGAEEPLRRAVQSGALCVTTEARSIGAAECVVVVIGTPVDEHLNADPTAIACALEPCTPFLSADQLLILRSTVFPGVTRHVERYLERMAPGIDVAFCPERIAEGAAMRELFELPQLIGARAPAALERAGELFRRLTDNLVFVQPEEAELAKLFTNAWRYIKFSVANQFFIMANEAGLDFERIRDAVVHDYPRAADLPRAGFAAGPCLLKDTMQLSAFNNNQFILGHSAMLVNEGLPLYLVSKLEERIDLDRCVVGILGMAFKGESDDIRSSLSYKLKRLLRFRARDVLCTDPYVIQDLDLTPLEAVLDDSDVLIVGAPHDLYRKIEPRDSQLVVDIWNLLGRGVLV